MNKYPISLLKELKQAARENKAPIWSRIAQHLGKPKSAHRVTNLMHISKFTKNDDTVIYLGKVLGTGTIDHKITLCSFGISNGAAQKILESGGRIVKFSNIIKDKPTGLGVVLLG